MKALSSTLMVHPFVFFSLRSFQTDVGETLRIYGVVNALAAAGYPVTLISNAVRLDAFHPAVRHINLEYHFKGKRWLQGLLSLLPVPVVSFFFRRLSQKAQMALRACGATGQRIFFFDYLDNTIGYFLAKTGQVAGYVNDVHGMAAIEFQNSRYQATKPFRKLVFRVKEWLADRLDRKVFQNADGLIFGSLTMQHYFVQRYQLTDTQKIVLPYLLDAFSLAKQPSPQLLADAMKALGTVSGTFTFLFVGTYKATAGVEDLMAAFDQLYTRFKNVRLVLIGDGSHRAGCEARAESYSSKAAIVFLNPVPYATLSAYYNQAQVIVCPDRDNPFSQYIVHIKYPDALATGKLVINGSFTSVQELNTPQQLSMLFQPSDVADLFRNLYEAYTLYEEKCAQFAGTANWIRQHYTYSHYTDRLNQFNDAVQTQTTSAS
ncbi:MAG: glycosyltransferase [Sphingobacteriales bacterium]|nr:MAG: glycosyltransferase [Sphingobacteriales bacterium]